MAFIAARTPPNWARRNAARLGSIDQVMTTIQKTESANPTLNNPGNLIYGSIAKQYGGSPSSHCFTDTNTGNQDCIAQFPDPASGSNAEAQLIQNLAASGMTIQQFTNTYAPAGSGNNPQAYAQYIAQATGLSVNDPLSAAIAANGSPAPFVGPIQPAPTPPPSPGDSPVSIDTPPDTSGDSSGLDSSGAASTFGGFGALAFLAAAAIALVIVSEG